MDNVYWCADLLLKIHYISDHKLVWFDKVLFSTGCTCRKLPMVVMRVKRNTRGARICRWLLELARQVDRFEREGRRAVKAVKSGGVI